MELKDFVNYFQDVEVCYFNNNYNYQNYNYACTKKNALWFTVDVPATGEYYFSII